ncbi:putative metalloprotease CJM1_0395 family protein [Shewanella fodinae]|uniref:putative metalloprotease CJM1_0395 family protein n=1 Tax=Shewanella fodinae TaxID=552357 RepID=UPI0019938384|nr:putative metalloprotease CJM1_0395 family protein [Shewanella fodinae]MCL2905622.1 hypothetical protein [Shewanella fodinae]GGY92443.1 hypothetical protein GCM10007169_07150 [Shewanella fodinae]
MFPALLSLKAPTVTSLSNSAVVTVPVSLEASANLHSAVSNSRYNNTDINTAVLSADSSAVLPQRNRSGLVSLSLGVLGAAALTDNGTETTTEQDAAIDDASQNDSTDKANGDSATVAQSPQQQQQLEQLKQRDDEVRTHERAHATVGGVYAGQPQFDYEDGVDGKRYAVNGEVDIDVSVIPSDPQATMNKMKQVYAAAMAPNDPSSADIQVAAEAMRKYNSAREQLTAQRSGTDPQLVSDAAKQYTSQTPVADSEQSAQDNVNAYPLSIARIMGQVNAQQHHASSEDRSLPPVAAHDLDNISLPNATLEEQQLQQQDPHYVGNQSAFAAA